MTNTNTRMTLASTNARIDGLLQAIETLTHTIGSQPAQQAVPARKTTKARKTATPQAPKAAAVTKGSQGKAVLGRKAWNETLSAKARLSGKRADGTSVYRAVMDAWVQVQSDRDAGLTPDQILAKFL